MRVEHFFGSGPVEYPKISGGGQNLERRNVERSIFQNFKIANSKMTKDELFDIFIVEFVFFIFYELLE